MDTAGTVGENQPYPLDITKDVLGSVIQHWAPIIAAWAIRKKWMDPDNPRDPLHLLMLVHTEVTELEQAIANNDETNTREEIADTAIRLIQMMAEHKLPLQPSSAVLRPLDIDAALSSAAEVWRHRTKTGSPVWENMLSAELVHAILSLCRLHIGRVWDGSLGSIWYGLHMMIAEKMEINEGRPVRHGKDA